jgi:hypothetical protein
MQIIVVQSGLYVTAIATTIIGIHTTYIHALILIYLYMATAMYTCMHALQLNYRGSGRGAP